MRLVKNGLITIVMGVATAFSAATLASDEYRLSAFADVSGYAQIKSKNITEATEFIMARSEKKMDFLELNNLCVLEVLVADFSSAIEVCENALEKSTNTRGIGFGAKKKAEASIHSNLAVAKALSGDLEGAKIELEMALSLNSRDSNAKANLEWLAGSNLVAGL
ncbi:MAG: tetratricopeptide repeat protein [Pseudohongiellaceae bacterium]